jgi:transposase-like protein
MVCHNCQLQAKKFGKDRKGVQRFRCNGCKKTFSELQDRPLGTMRLPMEKALQVLQLLVEGVSSVAQSESLASKRKRFSRCLSA